MWSNALIYDRKALILLCLNDPYSVNYFYTITLLYTNLQLAVIKVALSFSQYAYVPSHRVVLFLHLPI
uniref:Uncharacterized protein n=1 Tax=Pararge aegeria TaxID=116150 RepID=S4PEA9_9NEOP